MSATIHNHPARYSPTIRINGFDIWQRGSNWKLVRVIGDVVCVTVKVFGSLKAAQEWASSHVPPDVAHRPPADVLRFPWVEVWKKTKENA